MIILRVPEDVEQLDVSIPMFTAALQLPGYGSNLSIH